MWLAALGPLGLLSFGRVRGVRLVSLVVVCCLVAVVGCGAGRTIPLDGGGGGSGSGLVTPSGTYNIVASASSVGLSRTVNLTLVVQ